MWICLMLLGGKKSLRKEGRFSWVSCLKAQAIMAATSWQQELEVAGHITSAVKKQTGGTAMPSSLSPFYPLWDPSP